MAILDVPTPFRLAVSQTPDVPVRSCAASLTTHVVLHSDVSDAGGPLARESGEAWDQNGFRRRAGRPAAARMGTWISGCLTLPVRGSIEHAREILGSERLA